MIYKVKAKFNYSKAIDYYEKLNNGTIQSQKPDGYEIINAMNRATIDNEGYVNWTELCFCSTPLKHERETVYDKYFTELEAESIIKHHLFEGQSFIDKLKALVNT